jgi:hypothetical protein
VRSPVGGGSIDEGNELPYVAALFDRDPNSQPTALYCSSFLASRRFIFTTASRSMPSSSI